MIPSVTVQRARIAARSIWQQYQQQQLQQHYQVSTRWYVSRAHPPKSTPTYAIADAVSMVLSGVMERKDHREKRWDKNKHKLPQETQETPYRNQDETIELALNLNLDPRKPGQALRGTIPLPHGTGKTARILVFASDAATAQAAKEVGGNATVVAGGQDLIQAILAGDTPVSNFDRALATPDMMSSLSSIARILGPRGLMPNAKLDTIQPPENMVHAIREQAKGMVQYRTDKNGIVHAGIGKGSFTTDELLDNIKSFMNEIHNVKPESFGKGKKKKAGGGGKKGGSGSGGDAKYYLKAHLTSTQGKGSVNVDLRTVDPTSSFFMTELPE